MAPKTGNRKSQRGAVGKEAKAAAKQAEVEAQQEALLELQRRKAELQQKLALEERMKAELEKRAARAALPPLSDEERATEVSELTELAKTLMELAAAKQAATKAADIKNFAATAAGFAAKIRTAEDNQIAAGFKAEVARRKEQWTELAQMIAVAIQMEEMQDEEKQALKMAEDKLRTTAEQLSRVSKGGDTKVFEHIKNVAKDAEESLEEFLAADTNEKKWQAFDKAEQKREKWLTQITGVQETVRAEDSAARGPQDAGCEYVEDGCLQVDAALSGLNECLATSFGSWDASTKHFTVPGQASRGAAPEDWIRHTLQAPSGEAVVLAASPEEAREQLRSLVFGEGSGLLTTLLKASLLMKDDNKFSAIFPEVSLLLMHCHSLMTAGEKSDKQEAATQAAAGITSASRAIAKYDLYTATERSDKIATHHPHVVRCARLFGKVAEFFRAELLEEPLDDGRVSELLSLVRETEVPVPAEDKPARMSSVVVC